MSDSQMVPMINKIIMKNPIANQMIFHQLSSKFKFFVCHENHPSFNLIWINLNQLSNTILKIQLLNLGTGTTNRNSIVKMILSSTNHESMRIN